MADIWLLIQALVERGLIYSLVVLGVYITSRIIKFDDLTVEGSFGLGGALGVAGLLWGLHPALTMFIVLCAGACAGLITGLLHTTLRINNLISGIVVTTGLFSINLKIAGANATIIGQQTIFDMVPASLSIYKFLPVLILVAMVAIYGVRIFLNTEIGYLIRAVGDNPQMLTNLGKNIHHYKITALVLGNMLTACAGALFTHYVGYFSIWASVGILVSALAGLILAELIGPGIGISLALGSIMYQAIITTTFELELAQEWNKLVTAVLIVALLAIKSYTATKTRK